MVDAHPIAKLTKAALIGRAIDGSRFKAVNNRYKNFTRAKVERRRGNEILWPAQKTARPAHSSRTYISTNPSSDARADNAVGPTNQGLPSSLP